MNLLRGKGAVVTGIGNVIATALIKRRERDAL